MIDEARNHILHTLIIGAGQAGLCMSYHLAQSGSNHLVLERARVGERWRSERWRSLRFQFPNRYLQLPGFRYSGADPDGFMHAAGVVDILEQYAKQNAVPLRCGVDVRSIDQAGDGTFVVHTNTNQYQAENIVLATGPYQRTLVPSISQQLPTHIHQLTASSYSHPAALVDGAVLVVGSGGSGVQIAEDLIDAGRTTYLCVGKHKRVPRQYRGRDVMDWMEAMGATAAAAPNPPAGDHSPLLTGVKGGYTVDLRDLHGRGGHLLGRLEAVENHKLILGGNLEQDIAAGDQAYIDAINAIDAYIATQPALASIPRAEELPIDAAKNESHHTFPPVSMPVLDLAHANVQTVIWATGYTTDFSWIEWAPMDSANQPIHERGISPVPGLYYLGLPFLHNVRSSIFWGVGDDAQHISAHIARHR